MSLVEYDKKLARQMHDEINCIGVTENAIFPDKVLKKN